VHVQTAIDASSNGDTILVEPGIYTENINYSGKDLIITSRYLYTHDVNYINSTILDGGRSGRVVVFENEETRAAQLNGFTIRNGFITRSNEHPEIRYGAGVYISNSSPRITNCTITNNHIPSGGAGSGLGILYYSSPYLSKLSIHNNWSGMGGGGVAIGYWENFVEWDPINKCSIYNNYGASQNDINIGENYPVPMEIPLDTFSVSHPDEHFVGLAQSVTLTIDRGHFGQVSHNLYVSPDGNDSNSGDSPQEPLKTIQYALSIIESDSLNPRAIFLAPGTYSPSTGQHFPLNLKSYVSLQGAGKTATILDGENETQLIMARYDNYYRISGLTIQNAAYQGSHNAITLVENIEAEYHDLRISENPAGAISMLGYSGEDLPHPLNSSILIDSLEIINNTCRWTMYLSNHRNATFQNSIIRSSQSVYDEVLERNLNYPLQLRGSSSFGTQSPILVSNVEISNNSNMDAFYPGIATGVYIEGVAANLINCTIADNQAASGAAVTLFNAKAIIVNSILYGNDPYQIYLYNPLTYSADTLVIKNCIVENGEFGILEQGENNIQWLDSNLDVNPWYLGDDSNPYYLASNSPAIDAGTALFIWEGDTIVNMLSNEYAGLAPDIGAYEYHDPDALTSLSSPENFELYPNYPNPFNSSTQITFSLPSRADVELVIYNLKGQQVEQQSLTDLEAGTHTIHWNANKLSSGIFLYEIISGRFKLSGKASLVK